jgi:hypothetical protein
MANGDLPVPIRTRGVTRSERRDWGGKWVLWPSSSRRDMDGVTEVVPVPMLRT